MAHSGARSGQRIEVAPPRDSSARAHRSGYILLAASGVVLATAFGGLAELTASSGTPGIQSGNSNSGAQLVPGTPTPGQETITVSGDAQPASSTTTTAPSTGPDGKPSTSAKSSGGAPTSSNDTVPTTTTPRQDPPTTTTPKPTTTTTTPPPSSSSTTTGAG
jgi:hypothetical protein